MGSRSQVAAGCSGRGGFRALFWALALACALTGPTIAGASSTQTTNTCFGSPATILGTEGNDQINGTAASEDESAGPAREVGNGQSAEEYERLLLQRLRASDSQALDELVDRAWDGLVSYAERILGSVDAAEDVVQESFVRLWTGRARWERDGSARAVLYRITRNLALDERRKRAVRERTASRGTGPTPERPPTPLELAEASDLHRSLMTALAGLTDRTREIFNLSRFHGLSHGEIAKVLDLAPQTVSNLLTRILDSLRRQLRPFLAEGADPKVVRLPRRHA
jgi:RNA polymerase sigma-70 factor, ECF subfamily